MTATGEGKTSSRISTSSSRPSTRWAGPTRRPPPEGTERACPRPAGGRRHRPPRPGARGAAARAGRVEPDAGRRRGPSARRRRGLASGGDAGDRGGETGQGEEPTTRDVGRGLAAAPRGARRGRRAARRTAPRPRRRARVVLANSPRRRPVPARGARKPTPGPRGDRSRRAPDPRSRRRSAPGLTLDDLKKAPPEYVDLPIARRTRSSGEDAPAPVAAPAPTHPAGRGGGRGRPFAESIAGDRRASASPATARGCRVVPARRRGSGTELLWEEGDEERDVLPVPRRRLRHGPRHRRPARHRRRGRPAWEEPTSHSVLRDLAPQGLSERNLPAAVITAGVLIVAAIVSTLDQHGRVRGRREHHRAHRAGRAVRHDAPPRLSAGDGARPGDRRHAARRRVPARRAGDADVRRAGRRALVPLVHGRAAQGARGHAPQHRRDAARHRLRPVPRGVRADPAVAAGDGHGARARRSSA